MTDTTLSTHEFSASDDSDGPAVDYAAHPFLDPELFVRDPGARRYFQRLFRDHLRNDGYYAQLLNRLLHPVGEERPVEENERLLASTLSDASTYVRELLVMLPPTARMALQPDRRVERCDNLRELAGYLFRPGDGTPRERRVRQYEAQRKLYLAKLLLRIENTRMVQDGPRHREYLATLFDQELWSHVIETREWNACYLEDEPGRGQVRPGSEAQEGAECWNFHVRRVQRELPGGGYDIEIHHFDTRFKRETAGYVYRPGRSSYEITERPRYEHMQRSRSASILSKMLRKGLNDPTRISDMLGAKFIVAKEEDVHQLVDLLHEVLGGPFLFRNQVDLFRRPADHAQLNRFSHPEYRVFKEDVDLLYPAHGSARGRAYSFAVELQILTVESFLRTLHSGDYASHRLYKLRQFLMGVMPYVFPASLYGRPDLSELSEAEYEAPGWTDGHSVA